jgi:LysR family transcriptional regulator, cyn operon transcriptional activator
MELRHPRYFLAVAEHHGFRKAALSLRVSHPSLCAQMTDLETEIGTRLFERTNQRVSLTQQAVPLSVVAWSFQLREEQSSVRIGKNLI